MRTQEFCDFIKARDAVRVAKEADKPKPWTQDKILQSYRFCNVRREDDKVTRWIAANWREPLGLDPDLWFWMLVARLVNNTRTLMRMSDRLVFDKKKWNADKFVSIMNNMKSHGLAAWGGAYIVSTNGVQMEKAEYIAANVLSPAWANRRKIQPKQHDTLRSFCDRLLTLNGVQGFIAGQVIADAKYADEDLSVAADWHTFAVSGPGSRRGLNRVVGRDKDASWREFEWHELLLELREATNKKLRLDLHAQDVQNCLCEFDKYERVRLGEGKPRSSYPGLR